MSYNGAGIFQLVSGNPVVTGTLISSTWANNTLNDIANNGLSNCITKDGQQTVSANIPFNGFRLTGIGDAVNLQDAANARQIQNGGLVTLSTVAGTDTITSTASPTPAAYVAGQRFQFVSAGPNATNAVTLNISGLGAKSILKNGSLPLVPGDIASGQMVTVIYDGIQFQLQSAASLSNHGQCRLSVSSTTTLKLSLYNGNSIIINGSPQQIPASGVTVSNTGLGANTLYYVYAFMNSGVMTLEVVLTTHGTGGNGVETKSGDPTRTLVGMVQTNGSVLFVDSPTFRGCASWFNRQIKSLAQTGTNSTASTSLVTLSSAMTFLEWGDDAFSIGISGFMSNSTAGAGTQAVVTIDGSTAGQTCIFSPFAINANGAISSRVTSQLAEGAHSMFMSGLVGGGNGSYTYSIDGFTRC